MFSFEDGKNHHNLFLKKLRGLEVASRLWKFAMRSHNNKTQNQGFPKRKRKRNLTLFVRSKSKIAAKVQVYYQPDEHETKTIHEIPKTDLDYCSYL